MLAEDTQEEVLKGLCAIIIVRIRVKIIIII